MLWAGKQFSHAYQIWTKKKISKFYSIELITCNIQNFFQKIISEKIIIGYKTQTETLLENYYKILIHTQINKQNHFQNSSNKSDAWLWKENM